LEPSFDLEDRGRGEPLENELEGESIPSRSLGEDGTIRGGKGDFIRPSYTWKKAAKKDAGTARPYHITTNRLMRRGGRVPVKKRETPEY